MRISTNTIFRKRVLLSFVLIILVIAGISYITFFKDSNKKGPLTEYNPNGTCKALIPECGFCPGQIDGDECIVEYSDFYLENLKNNQ